MPTIAWFYGIAIQMFYNDHSPPYLHARYGRAKAVMRPSDGEIIGGELRRLRSVSFGTGCWNDAQNWTKIGGARERTCLLKALLAPMPTSDFPMVDVLRLRPLEGHRLWLRFTDGSEGVRDLSDVIAEGGVMVQSWGTQSELPPPKSRKL
jgi:hypothetical protein